MKILITGAGGFVGSAITRHLIAAGHSIVALVHRSPAPLLVAHSIRVDLGAADTVETILKACEPVDAIVHAAACINYQNTCPDIVRVNCLGLQQMLAVAQQWRAHTFINFSSIGVLGLPIQHPITERHPTSPRTAYHASKLFGEYLTALFSTDAVSGVSLRLTAPVGIGMPPGRILAVFVRQALGNKPLTLSGQGRRKQNYIDVRDIAQAVTRCLEHRPTGIFNLGGASTLSNLELAKRCIELLHSSSNVEFTGQPDPADDEMWDVCNEAAKAAFQYEPAYDIESAIKSLSTHLNLAESLSEQ